jgi:hypothetical protein
MRLVFALMDSDGDGTVSLQEFQAAHEKIFKAMDTESKAGSMRFRSSPWVKIDRSIVMSLISTPAD